MNCGMNPPLRRKANFKWADSVTVRPKAELLQMPDDSSAQDFALTAKYVRTCKLRMSENSRMQIKIVLKITQNVLKDH